MNKKILKSIGSLILSSGIILSLCAAPLLAHEGESFGGDSFGGHDDYYDSGYDPYEDYYYDEYFDEGMGNGYNNDFYDGYDSGYDDGYYDGYYYGYYDAYHGIDPEFGFDPEEDFPDDSEPDENDKADWDLWKDGNGWAEGDADDQAQYGQQVDEDALLTWETGIGSAGELDGNIVVVSIFADDARTQWDFSEKEDLLMQEHSLSYLKLATDWISEQAANWGKAPVFFYNWAEDPELYYEAEISIDVTDEDEDPSYDMWDFIDENIDTDALMEKYDAESIVFMSYINTPMRNNYPSYTIPYDDSLEEPYEICYMLIGCSGEEEAPAAYAHEMLHTFGAPDLYTCDFPEYNYNIDADFVSYCEKHHANEIMMTTFDYITGRTYYDHISNVLTDITAYYIGWTDSCQEVADFHLQESQFID